MAIRLRTLGSPSVLVDGTERGEMRARPVRLALLLYLAMERDVSRDRVMALLWPESDKERARQALRQTLYALRQDLGEEWLEAEGDTLRATASLQADAREAFEAMDAHDPERFAHLYRGGFLEGFHLAESQPFQLWCDQWRARLERFNRQARRALIDERVHSGDLTAALAEARRWLDLDPLEDEAQHRVLELLFRLGQGEEAVREYERYTALLAREGLEPLDETRALMEEIGSAGSALDPLDAGPGEAESVPGKPTASTSGQDPGDAGTGRWIPLLRLGLPLLAVAGIVAGLLLFRGRGEDTATPPLVPERVLVLPLTNQTADSSLTDIGLLAQEWITHGVAHMGTLRAVPSMDVLQMLEAGMSGERAAQAREAGTLVSGRFFRVGDSLEFHVRVTDLARGELWHVLDPVRVAPGDLESGLRDLRDRVTGGLAVRFVPGSALPEPSVLDPPNYPAFQAFMQGVGSVARGNWEGALPHVQRAARLDTTFYRAHLYVAAALHGDGEHARADSVLHALARKQDHFSPYERLIFRNVRGALRGDWDGRLTSAWEAARLDPGGTLHYLSASIALGAGRPREALELYADLDLECPWAPELLIPWASWTAAHHLLGHHDLELEAAKSARGLHPNRLEALFLELRALAGLGHLEELRALLAETSDIPPEPEWNPGLVLYRTAVELRAHGHAPVAQEVLASALAWFEGRPGAERDSPSHQRRYVDALLLADRLQESAATLDGLRQEDSISVDLLGREAVLAARTGRDTRLRLLLAALEGKRGPYGFGTVDYWRSAVAAWSGRAEEALSHLRNSLAQGHPRGIELHADPFLEPLWSLPGFRLAVAQQD